MEGLIVKGIAGFYYVRGNDNKVIQCKARGHFKNKDIVPYVGDVVDFNMIDDEEGIIEKIHPRKNQFIRPPIVNVDLIIVVIAAEKPRPNKFIIDKFMVMAENSNTEVALCINKVDSNVSDSIKEIEGIYEGIYPVVKTSALENKGIDKLIKLARGKKVAFAGPSGVGKSTLLNAMQPSFNLQTGDISKKNSRGKHTTRHVEIFDTDFGGMLYDTPGFTSFEIFDVEEGKLQYMYPEIVKNLGECKYDNCMHINEPDCGILKKVNSGEISSSRYESYKKQIEEIKTKKKY